ncbi:MAG: hypothetical protein NVSMB32_16920 [Actinomycetota bacterium]
MLMGVDRVVSTDALTSERVTTLGRNELLVAMISGDGPLAAIQSVRSVTGGGLTWSRVVQANGVAGVAEVWQAHAPNRLMGVQVTAALDIAGYAGSITVIALRGSLHLGANASAGDTSGAPEVSLTTVGQDSVVLAVGHDWSRAIEPTPADGQVILHRFLSPATPDASWVQAGGPFHPAGSRITISDTAPTSDAWNLAAVEIVP